MSLNLQFELTGNLTRKVWRQLLESQVPVETLNDMRSIPRFVQELNNAVRSHSYVPDVVHGYLALEKNTGVSRFIPILSKEDIAVYYQLCGDIGNTVIENVPNVYGGWRVIPSAPNLRQLRSDRRIGAAVELYAQNYSGNTYSRAAWFQQFRDFNHMLRRTIEDREFGPYVAQTDIANFYDSIDIGRLISKLRRDASAMASHVDMLETFLTMWNRRISGYVRSSKGIPQEILSDGSRNLSHYYLQDFDRKFLEHCSLNSLKYVRWADDILIFGQSRQALHRAIYEASKILLTDGLNLSAPKTRIFTLQEYRRYRGLDILHAIETRNVRAFRLELRRILSIDRKQIKFETVFRAALGFISSIGSAATASDRKFLYESIETDPSLLSDLTAKQLFTLIKLSTSPTATFNNMIHYAERNPISGPKANILMLIRVNCQALARMGVTKLSLKRAATRLARGDSEIVRNLCLPATIERIDIL